ncbi:MAG TPA: hypothetical protein H9830_10430 [Candidatus Agrococcus pullicola]|uniref:Glycoside hydrolase family 38 N-terminal domain-containing protein n=1 Tax=Candidatus Agrococcus pullicola TaxID=2838429 RepID=A0A9D2CAD6_9MICO|nr:hypothetical protein [Candidatus Agrococcus pullicola]
MSIAHAIHHTHWDNIWYFTFEDAEIVFDFNFRQLLRYFDQGRVQKFHLDGQTAALDVFLRDHPELEPRVRELVTDGRLTVGPFESQLDCFISSGESVINNLRLGHKLAKRLGKVSDVAYLPDPFGHSIDFPKIFNQFGIRDFVVTRGVGGPYGLRNEFRWRSDDGSELLVHTLLAGYGYGTYAFREGTLFSDQAEDYNKLSVDGLIERLLENSALPGEFVFPLGFDQNPAIPDLPERVADYNAADNGIEFRLTTWRAFMDRVRERYDELQVFDEELYSTQYHRMHRSIFSARPDIKATQDLAERELALRTQPIMVLADLVGIPFEPALLDRLWTSLTRTQTHSSATMDDPSNAQIAQRAGDVAHAAQSLTLYLMRKLATNIPDLPHGSVLVANTLPWKRELMVEADIFTRAECFTLVQDSESIPYDVVERRLESSAVMRANPEDRDPDGEYWRTTVRFRLPAEPLSLQSVFVDESEGAARMLERGDSLAIENEHLHLAFDGNAFTLQSISDGRTIADFLTLEDSGDEGDNYDYSYPDNDRRLEFDWSGAEIVAEHADAFQRLRIRGDFEVPRDLSEREGQATSGSVDIDLTLELRVGDPLLRIHGGLTNYADNHRVRLIFATDEAHADSVAGTQFSTVRRRVDPAERKTWREEGWFEEPSPQYPLLNHVSLTGSSTLTCYTRSAKEYEVVGGGYKDLAVVIFRAVGHMGLPDLNRRPGRPSGLDFKVLESPDSQLHGRTISVDLAVGLTAELDPNANFARYAEFAADPVVHTHQRFDKAAHPILYFPVNTEEVAVPVAFSAGGFDAPVPYSTLTMGGAGGAPLLRVFNASASPLRQQWSWADEIEAIDAVALGGETLDEHLEQLELQPGQLRTLSLQRRSTPWRTSSE